MLGSRLLSYLPNFCCSDWIIHMVVHPTFCSHGEIQQDSTIRKTVIKGRDPVLASGKCWYHRRQSVGKQE